MSLPLFLKKGGEGCYLSFLLHHFHDSKKFSILMNSNFPVVSIIACADLLVLRSPCIIFLTALMLTEFYLFIGIPAYFLSPLN